MAAKKSKLESLRQTAHTGRMQERAAPLNSNVTDRLTAFEAFEQQQADGALRAQAAQAPPIEKIVEVLRMVQERIAIDVIKDRLTDIRPVSESRAQRFAGSIALFGLIQPIAIDLNNHLLAGDHRRRAMNILRELAEWPERVGVLLPGLDQHTQEQAITAWRRHGFDLGVPVYRMDIDAVKDPVMAKAIELAENTNREDFSKEEVKRAYQELKTAGYRHVVGRPKKGEKAIGPELELLYGKASRTITKYIAELRTEEQPAADPQASAVVPEPSAAMLRLKQLFPTVSVKTGKKGGGFFTVPFQSDEDLAALLEAFATPGRE